MSRDAVMALFLSLAGPAIWFAHFSAMYGAETLSCLDANPAEAQTSFQIAAAVATAVTLAGLAWLVVRGRAPSTFLERMSLALSALAALAVLWTALPVLLLPACVS